MHAALAEVEHRPWALPERPWTWRQSWCDLLFAHWPLPVEMLAPLVPRGLEVQQFEGTSWVGIVPFRMQGVMRRSWPDLPGISAFAELNVRIYVERDGKPGVWFLSLDAANRLAVWAARRYFHLPYYHAAIDISSCGEWIHYRSQRRDRAAPVCFAARYRATSAAHVARAGSLAHFLTERYCLYAQDADGALYRCEVHHVPWPLQQAEAEIETNELLAPLGVVVEGPPLVYFARRVDALVWPLEPLGR